MKKKRTKGPGHIERRVLGHTAHLMSSIKAASASASALVVIVVVGVVVEWLSLSNECCWLKKTGDVSE